MTRKESQLEWGDFDNGEIVRYVEGSLGFMRITSFALYPDEYGQSRAYGEDKHGQPAAAFVKNLHEATGAEKAAFAAADDAHKLSFAINAFPGSFVVRRISSSPSRSP